MPLFTPSLYRNFAFGFLLGGIGLVTFDPAFGSAMAGLLA